MDDVHESDLEAGTAAAPGHEPGDPTSRPAPRGRAGAVLGLPRRTVAICVCIATIGALVAALITSALLADDSSEPAATAELQALDDTDSETMLAVGLTTIDGKPTTLAAHLDGRPVVVNLWAQSCVPCVDEMPLLEEAHQANPDVAFFGVDTQDRLEKALAMAEQTGITYPWAQDPAGNFFYAANAAGMPTTLFLDERGRILSTKTGAFADRAELQAWIDEHRPAT